MEGYKKLCEAIKSLNERIWYYNYVYGKNSEHSKFLEETKRRFLDLYLLDKEIEFAIISAGTGKKQTIKFGLITTELTLNDNGS